MELLHIWVASFSDVPQMVLMIKVDKADPSVAKDIKKVFVSEPIQEKVRYDELLHLDADRW